MALLPWPHTEFIHPGFDRKLNYAVVKTSARSAEHSLACSCFGSGTVSVICTVSGSGECFYVLDADVWDRRVADSTRGASECSET